MTFCYKKLWKLLIDRGMKKKELGALAGVSSATLAKMNKGGTVSTDVLLKICVALNCDVSDIMEINADHSERATQYYQFSFGILGVRRVVHNARACDIRYRSRDLHRIYEEAHRQGKARFVLRRVLVGG